MGFFGGDFGGYFFLTFNQYLPNLNELLVIFREGWLYPRVPFAASSLFEDVF